MSSSMVKLQASLTPGPWWLALAYQLNLSSHLHPILLYIPATLNCHLILFLHQHSLSKLLALPGHIPASISSSFFTSPIKSQLNPSIPSSDVIYSKSHWDEQRGPFSELLCHVFMRIILALKPCPKTVCLSFSFLKSGPVHP